MYNGESLRVAGEVNGQLTRYLYEYSKVILEVDGSGNQTAMTVYGTNPISRTAGVETVYYFYNGHGDVTVLMDVSGEIQATYYYDAFGSITEETGSADNPYRYSGYRYDEETGYYYLNSRYYDPKIARFLTEDSYRGSIDDPLSLNLYTYCVNNPIKYYDPTGHAFTEWDNKNVKNEKDRKAIIDATREWTEATTDKKRAAAHAKAEAARDKYRDANEKGRDDGFTVTKDTNKISTRDSSEDKSSKSGSSKETPAIAILYDLDKGSFYSANVSSTDGYRDYLSSQVLRSIQQGRTYETSKQGTDYDNEKKGVFGIGYTVSLHALSGASTGKVVYFDRHGNIAIMNTGSYDATNDFEASVGFFGELSINASSVDDMDGEAIIGGFGGDLPGVSTGANYQFSKSTTTPVTSHSLTINANVSLMPVVVLAGRSKNEAIIKFNIFNILGIK